jgi:site-specific recombinase XerD
MLPEIQRFKSWLRRKAPHASNPIHYANDLALFFAWLDKPVSEVTVVDIDRYIEHCQEKGQAVATINRRLAALCSFYHFLTLEADDAPKNPVRPKRHFLRHTDPLPRDIQDADLEKLFAVIHTPRDRAMFLLMLRCGLRVSEVRNLSLPDLYLEPAPGSLPRLWLHGKGGRQRVVYLSHQPLAALQAWLEERPAVKDKAVFLNRFGKRLTVTGIQDRLAGYCHTAGLWLTCHQFRHTFGRHLTEARLPVTTIQRLLGHACLRTTEIYLHISDSQLQDDYDTAMNLVNHRLDGQGEPQ